MKQSKLFSKVFVIMLTCILMTGSAYSLILQNGSGKGYEPPISVGTMMDNSIETYIEIGGGYFLKSHSDILSFLNKIEMSEVNGSDYNEWLNILKSALDNMKNAKNTYEVLIKTAEATQYNREIIAKLENFDYASFARFNNLNGILFKEVEHYLGAGDITGCYKYAYAKICKIEKLLVSVSDEVSLNKMPELTILWKLNGLCAETLIQGQYVAMVFSKI
ncbi:MAG TPA: hypothetical protein VK186_13145 [Candidatus Deferrimicrobium sp.]|nr:hypothetical protein [Candidatus Deferrimicrobium sp.]